LGYAEVLCRNTFGLCRLALGVVVPAVFALGCALVNLIRLLANRSELLSPLRTARDVVKRVGQSLTTAPVSGLALLSLFLRRLLCLLRHCSLLMGGDSACRQPLIIF
jgi:hypothetical protein